MVPAVILAGFWIYFMRKAQLHALANEVLDFVEPKDRGGQISFWVESKSASDVVEMNRVASDIRAKALKAREGRA